MIYSWVLVLTLVKNGIYAPAYSDAERSEAIASWVYQVAANNGAQLWVGKREFGSINALEKPKN